VIVNPEPAGLRLREQVDRRRRRDVLRAAGAARRAARARRVRRARRSPSWMPCCPGGAGHRGRRGQARCQQPAPGGAGPEAHPRRRPALRPGGAVHRRRTQDRGGHDLRLRLRARPAHQCGRPAGRHDAGHRVPADRRRGARRRTGDARWTASTASARDRGRHARAGAADRGGLFEEGEEPPPAICVFDPDFHEGVVGIVASRIKDKLHRPTFVFAASQAPGKEHELKGSGRSIPGFHLRDALDLVAKRHPGVLLRFGGHAMAAGCTVAEEHLDTFEQALAQVAQEWLDAATLLRRLHTDGPLAPEYRRPTWSTRCTRRCGARASRRRCSARRWKWCRSAGGREAPGAEAAAPGPAGRRHLVRPHRAAAGAREASPSASTRTNGRACGGCAS
jgi:hypothetical protein